MLTQGNKLVKQTVAHGVASAPRPTGEPAIPPESASAMDIQGKNLEKTLWLFHGILDHVLNYVNEHEIVLDWDPNDKTSWDSRNNGPERAIFWYFERMCRSLLNRCE